MQLFYSPMSHFARKVRILAAHLNVPLDLVDAGSPTSAEAEHFGNNPLMKVPTLSCPEGLIFESDTISRYLVHRFDPGDRFAVLTEDIQRQNARAVMNGVMTAEVELLLAARSGVDVANAPRYHKLRQVIAAGLLWLEQNADLFAPEEPDYNQFHLLALWEHLLDFQTSAAFQNMPELELPHLARHTDRIGQLPLVAASRHRVDIGHHRSPWLP